MSRHTREGAAQAALTPSLGVQLSFPLPPEPMASEFETIFSQWECTLAR